MTHIINTAKPFFSRDSEFILEVSVNLSNFHFYASETSFLPGSGVGAALLGFHINPQGFRYQFCVSESNSFLCACRQYPIYWFQRGFYMTADVTERAPAVLCNSTATRRPGYEMCGRTACTLAPEDVSKSCEYKDKQGHKKRPHWRDGDADKYHPSYNKSPQSNSPVLLSMKHLQKVG
ncbi:hypothetical protein GDO81_023227 [Engystomops pustulosus]|uniref:Uncharacterized protein n=1 Tax=Engystomops pustulosus TaxID=76066 RepID=A0AAV6YT52_ENGPU|nr:hypothetical protein GDO81_023227 [Engystomops pustulosus]